jgi:hypothetical protein
MPTTPRISIDDATLPSQACAICGERTLRVAHVERLPDYVACGHCGSIFVMEDGGDRVMYGKIPAEYPQTSSFALRQWLTTEEVQERATAERGIPAAPQAEAVMDQPDLTAAEPEELTEVPGQMGEAEPAVQAPMIESQPEETAEKPGEPAARFQALLRSYEEAPQSTIPDEGEAAAEGFGEEAPWAKLAQEFEIPEPDVTPAPGAAPEFELDVIPPVVPPPAVRPAERPAQTGPAVSEPIPQEMAPAAPTGEGRVGEGAEPAAGTRFQVRIKGYRLRIPKNTCAHCLRIPASRTLTVLAPAPPGSQRQVVRLNAPLCFDCFRRANARSSEASSARLQAHLISALIAMFLVVFALAVHLVNLGESPGLGILLLLILAVVGYGVPAFFLLGRSGRFPPPDDALFVRSTLVVSPEADPPGMTFSWRNQGFAELFHEANNKATEGPVLEIAEQPAEDGS